MSKPATQSGEAGTGFLPFNRCDRPRTPCRTSVPHGSTHHRTACPRACTSPRTIQSLTRPSCPIPRKKASMQPSSLLSHQQSLAQSKVSAHPRADRAPGRCSGLRTRLYQLRLFRRPAGLRRARSRRVRQGRRRTRLDPHPGCSAQRLQCRSEPGESVGGACGAYVLL